MKNAELASDAVLMEDMHLTMSVPELAGPVCGFGTEKDHINHRSIGKLMSHDWDDSSFYFGSSDTWG